MKRNFFKEIQQFSVSKKHSWNISRKIGMWKNDSAIEFSLKTRMAVRLRKVSVSARISYFEESFRGAASRGIDPQVIREP